MQRVSRQVVEVAVVVWLLIDLQRVWAPSLITIVGRAASTPPELMGLFALAVVASPALLLATVRRSSPRRRGVAATRCLAGALLARVVVQLAEGDRLQLWAASAGVVLALAALCLATRRGSRDLLVGVLAGLALATVTHAALGTWAAVWRDDGWSWVLLGLQVAAVCGLIATGRLDARRVSEPAESDAPATSALLAFWLLPALLLAGIALANVGRATAAGGALGAAVVAAGTVLAAGVVLVGPRLRVWTDVVAAVVLVATTWAVLDAPDLPGLGSVDGVAPVAAATLGVIALAVVLLRLPAGGTPRRDPMWAVWGGGLVWVGVLFGYYAGYDLGYRADWLIVVLAAALGVAAVGQAWRARRAEAAAVTGTRAGWVVTALAAVVALVVAWAGPVATVRPVADHDVAREAGLTVMAWNLRMGYGIDGRFRVEEVAELVAAEAPDVVLLSEIDRGWLLNGGQDQLSVLARLLDMDAHFGPAADPVWGDAILTRLPVRDVVARPLPDFGAVTGAQVMAATVIKDGQEYDVLSTHLQPADHGPGQGSLLQARRIAAFAEARRRDGRPLVLGGDFNVVPGSESFLTLLDAGLDDGLAGSRPLFTSPADGPEQQIDHLFVSRGTWVSAAWAVRTELSDHFPVLVTIAAPGLV